MSEPSWRERIKKIPAVIMAAGKSSRFWPLNFSGNKCLTSVMGQPILAYTIRSLVTAGIKEIILVINQSEKDTFRGYFGEGQSLKVKIKYALQKKPLGQANAILSAKDYLKSAPEFLVFNAEQVNAGEFLPTVINFKIEEKADLVLVGKETSQPWKYGILELKEKRVVALVEKPAQGEEPSKLRVVGIYFLNNDFLEYLGKQPVAEYQLETSLNGFMKQKQVLVLETNKETISAKYPWDLLKVKDYLLAKIPHQVSPYASVAQTAIIKPPVIIKTGALIGEFATVEGPAYIGESAVVGAYSTLRACSSLELGAQVQRDVDVKNSLILPGAHLHSGFIGDSIIGEDCRVGADFLTANRRLDRQEIFSAVDGKKIATGLTSFGTVVGPKTRIGIRVSTMPGKLIGANCLIGPGKIVRENIDDKEEVW